MILIELQSQRNELGQIQRGGGVVVARRVRLLCLLKLEVVALKDLEQDNVDHILVVVREVLVVEVGIVPLSRSDPVLAEFALLLQQLLKCRAAWNDSIYEVAEPQL